MRDYAPALAMLMTMNVFLLSQLSDAVSGKAEAMTWKSGVGMLLLYLILRAFVEIMSPMKSASAPIDAAKEGT